MTKKTAKKTVKKKAAKKPLKKKKAISKPSKPPKPVKPITKRNSCPECGSFNIIYSKITDRVICQDCAAIFASLTPEDDEKFNAS
jgi:hypothetical protein